MKNTKSRLHRLRRNLNVDRVTVDIGGVSVSSIPMRGRAFGQLMQAGAIEGLTDPVWQTASLSAAAASALGSDYARCGLVFDMPEHGERATFNDYFGVTWDWPDEVPRPLSHPLEKAGYKDILALSKPALPAKVVRPDKQILKDTGMAIVCDAPVPGLLELCFRVRGQERFLEDMTTEPKIANSLLDWAVEVICEAYDQVLEELSAPPDLIHYGDDLGHQLGLFVSEEQFQKYLKPRMAIIIERLQTRSSEGILYRSKGAIGTLLKDICDLGVSFLNIQTAAAGMRIDEVRLRIPESTVLHGVTDFHGLCRALRSGHADGLLDIALSLATAWPVVAAASHRLSADMTREDLTWAASFIKTLDLGKKISRAEIVAERGHLAARMETAQHGSEVHAVRSRTSRKA